jgi:hypothetical protein
MNLHPDSSAQPASETFELAFQWDDGTFISPFVATERSAIEGLTEIIRELLLPEAQQGEANTFPEKCSIAVLDLGCGDGRVVAQTARSLAHLVEKAEIGSLLRTVNHISAAGVDLDEELVSVAKASAASSAAGETALKHPGSPTVEVRYFVRDLLALSPSDCLALVGSPCNTKLDSPAQPLRRRGHFSCIFTYLLPEALIQLQPLLEGLLPHVSCVVSNSWDIPYLEPWRRLTPTSALNASSGQCRLNVYARPVSAAEEPGAAR